MSTEQQNFNPNWVCPPSATIQRVNPGAAQSPITLADMLGVSTEITNGLLSDTVPINRNLAIKLSNALGGTSKFWEKRSNQYRDAIRVAEVRQNWNVYEGWLRKFPITDIKRFGWIEKNKSRSEDVINLLRFFECASLSEWESKFSTLSATAAFRTSRSNAPQFCALLTWFQAASHKAQYIWTAGWDPARLRSLIPYLRRLSLHKSPETFLPVLQEKCASSGLAVVVTPAPKNSHIYGLTTFLNSGNPLIALTFRYRSDDQFWFTFFHELAHLLLHTEQHFFFEGLDLIDIGMDEEEQADRFARDTLIPPTHFEELRNIKNDYRQIVRFSTRLSISPGIVVGQMQHYGYLGFNQMNHLKRKYNWSSLNLEAIP